MAGGCVSSIQENTGYLSSKIEDNVPMKNETFTSISIVSTLAFTTGLVEASF